MRMKRRGRQIGSRGVGAVEFACVFFFLTYLTLGYTAIGMNLLFNFQVVQLSRDAGHIFAQGLMYGNPNMNFSNTTTREVLGKIGGIVALNTPGGYNYPVINATTGNANVIVSKITYIDAATCQAAGIAAPNANNCPNLGQWAFAQQLVMGNKNVRSSIFGTPDSTYQSTIDGTIPIINSDNSCGYPCDTGDQVNAGPLTAIFEAAGASSTALPSGQYLCIGEASAYGFNLAPFVSHAKLFSYNIF